MNFWCSRILKICIFTVIAILIVFIYYPSFYHAPHADQIEYYANTAGRHSWFSLAIQSYDYNRFREFSPRDNFLFRPILYFILGTERYFFGYHFMFWQMTGVAAHLWAVWCLLNLLQRIQPGIFSFLLTGFFAMLFVNMEMVIWQNITAYMLFWGIVLVVLEQSYICAYQKWQSWRLWLIAGLLLIAVYTYEIGNVYALLIALFLWISCRKKQAFVLLIPIFLYALTNYWNFVAEHVHLTQDQKILNLPGIIDFLNKIVIFVKELLFWGLFPGNINILFRGEYNVFPGSLWIFRPLVFSITPLTINDPLVFESLLLVILYFWGLVRSGMNRLWKVHGKFLLLLVFMLLAYAAGIVYGRGASNGGFPLVIRTNLYYSYGFWALLISIVCVSIDTVHLRQYRESKIFQIIAVGIIGILIIKNSILLHRGLEEQARRDKLTIFLCRKVDGLIKEHKQEKDFSFYVDLDYPGNYYYAGLSNLRIPMKRYSFIEGMYLQYFKSTGAKYRIF